MKWKTNNMTGSKRITSAYAFIPTKLDDGYTVWMETYWVTETWDDGTTSDVGHGFWKNRKTSSKNPKKPDTGGNRIKL